MGLGGVGMFPSMTLISVYWFRRT